MNYEQDSNVYLRYTFKKISEKTAEKYFVNIVLNNTGISTFNYYKSYVFNVKVIYSTNGTLSSDKALSKVELYVQLYKTYNRICIMLDLEKTHRLFSL